MAYEDDYDSHEDCIAQDNAFDYVCENYWEELEEAINKQRGQLWLSKSKPCLDLLSTVSQTDRTQMQSSLKRKLQEQRQLNEELSEEQLFDVATNVSRLLEEVAASIPGYLLVAQRGLDFEPLTEPTIVQNLVHSARPCTLGDDLAWAQDLLLISRAFRDFLSIVSEGEGQGSAIRLRLREPFQVINRYLRHAPAPLAAYWEDSDRQIRFGQCPNPDAANLSSFIASWISEYLQCHFPQVGLGVCPECGRFFEKERRDKTFCSKTCQNRVAYKRKRVIESDAFTTVKLAPDDACDIESGMWLHHPRFGIGLVESIGNETTPMKSLLSDSEMPSNEQFRIRYRSMLSRRISVKVRFLSGMRFFGYADLFEGQKKEDQLPAFYKVNSAETLARLL